MQELPAAPVLSTWISIGALLAVGLVLLAFVAVITVLLSARRPIIPFQQIKAIAVTLLWIVPALAVVGLIGYRSEQRSESRPAIREEVRSTIRQTSSEPISNAVPVSLTITTEIPSRTTAIVAEAEQTVPLGGTETAGPGTTPAVETAGNRVDPNSPATDVKTGGDVKTLNSPQLDDSNERRLLRRQQRKTRQFDSHPVDELLKVRETHAAAPDWAEKEPVPGERGILVSLSSERFATLQEAEQQLTAKAVSYIKQFYRDEYPLSGDWTVPVSIIERNAVSNLVGETKEKDFGNGFQGTMYRAHLQLELNSALRKALHDSWHGQIIEHRLIVLGSMLGLVTLMLATSAGYFRLDDLTGGLYRRRLKFAAASLIAAGSLVALVVA